MNGYEQHTGRVAVPGSVRVDMIGGAGGVGPCDAARSIRPPSIEDRLNYLQLAIERMYRLRAQLGMVAQGLAPVPPQNRTETDRVEPKSEGLSIKLGEALRVLHSMIDDIEHVAGHIEASLYQQKPNAPTAGPVSR